MFSLKETRRPRIVLLTALLIVLWNASAWHFTKQFFLSETHQSVEQETRLAHQRTDDLADSIRRNLNYLHGVPDVIGAISLSRTVAHRFGTSSTPAILPYDEKRKLWTQDPQLNELSRYLALAEKALNVDLLYVMNAAGDCVASSNWDSTGTPIGSNYAERDYFKKNQMGQPGMQYAVGKTTHIPGLFFSSPIMIDGKFMGSVIAKANVPNLSFLLNSFDAFVTDNNGVIVLAHDKKLEMHALSDARVFKLSEQEKLAIYRQNSFPLLKIEPWNDPRFPSFLRIENKNIPQVMAAVQLPEYALQLHVNKEISAIPLLSRQATWFTFFIGALGSVVLMVLGGSALYFQSIKESRAQLWKKANFDTLTGLPNRDMFRDQLTQEIKKSDRSTLPLALLLIDLDQFKEVNDTLGHDIGDILLQRTVHRLLGCMRESDTVARLGGDEFTVVLSQLSDLSHIEDIAEKILARLAEPFDLPDEIVHISASIGIALYPADASDADNMMKHADQAMYVAKKLGRNRYSYYEAALQAAAQKRLRLINDLRGALTENQFRVYFQPIVELKTNRVHKAEALIRWQHPVRGMVNPAEFIPLAEETRLIIEIGAWVRTESIAWCGRWSVLNPHGFQISVNRSPVEFMHDDVNDSVDTLIEDLRAQGLYGNNLVLEITEGLLLNADSRINQKLVALRDAGIGVSIDDFGTGYSSLSYLKKFDIDFLKIDQSFVRNLEHGSDDMALCEAIIVMAHKLELKVIAEGVETVQQRDLLALAGCDYVQGYLYSRPLPPEEFKKWLMARS
jgi:diguanylate cyclase (GGDEF)-like protein